VEGAELHPVLLTPGEHVADAHPVQGTGTQ
jgi:hypothetical protein